MQSCAPAFTGQANYKCSAYHEAVDKPSINRIYPAWTMRSIQLTHQVQELGLTSHGHAQNPYIIHLIYNKALFRIMYTVLKWRVESWMGYSPHRWVLYRPEGLKKQAAQCTGRDHLMLPPGWAAPELGRASYCIWLAQKNEIQRKMSSGCRELSCPHEGKPW